ncbi:MAG TPA: response regulator [Drouetiella sp.]|jgi:two-component system, sensor histidine kinase and response regulator
MSTDINVLIIDHNTDDARLLQQLLTNSEVGQFAVECIENLQDGLQRLKTGGIDVLLLDLSMPESQGIKTFLTVRKETDNIPIVVLTGLDEHAIALEAVRLGAQDYLVKRDLNSNWLSRTLLYSIERFTANKEIKNLNEELVKARDEALAAARFKAEFLANMSHEIRTPMNAVIGMSDLLRRTSLNAEQSKFVEVIKSAGGALLNVVNDILLFSKMEAGRFPLENTEVNVLELVEGVAEILGGPARLKDLSLVAFVEPTVPRVVMGDPTRLRQILLNLGSNAVKFTDKGFVQLTVRNEPGQKNTLRFAIEDSGSGLSPDTMQRLFKPFSQGMEKAATTNGGTGLGLAISKLMVELMGGEIGVDSTQGQGSTFWFKLPVVLSEKQPDETANPTGRLLAVNFTPRELEQLRTFTTHYGVGFGSAADAKEAILEVERARKNGSIYDFALINVDPQILDHTTVPKDLAKLVNQLELFGILLTNFDQAALGEDALKAGFSAYLTRPLKQTQLLQCLDDLSNGKKLAPFSRGPNDGNKEKSLDPTLRVLIVEDNPINQEVANLQLKKLGLSALICSNGLEAVNLVKQQEFDVILMDCQMPVMDGFEATRQIRALGPQLKTSPIILAMTANAMEGDREECLAIGMDEYVAKPVTIDGLLFLLSKLLPDRLVDFKTHDIRFQLERSSRSATVVAEEAKAPAPATTQPTLSTLSTQPSDRTIDTEMLTANFGWESACRLLTMFADGTPAILEKLDKAITNTDSAQAKANSHELKGYCSTISMHEMAALSKQIGDATRSDDWTQARQLFAQLVTAFEKARKEIESTIMSSTTFTT